MKRRSALLSAAWTVAQIAVVSFIGLSVGALVISPATSGLPWLLPVIQGIALLTAVGAAAKWYRARTSAVRGSGILTPVRAARERGLGVQTPQAVQALVDSGKPLPEIVRRTKMSHDAISLLMSLSRVHPQPTA